MEPLPFNKNDILRMMTEVSVICDKIQNIEMEFNRELQPEMKEAFAMIHTQYKFDLTKASNGLFLWSCSTSTKDEYILGRIKGTKTFEGTDISR